MQKKKKTSLIKNKRVIYIHEVGVTKTDFKPLHWWKTNETNATAKGHRYVIWYSNEIIEYI